MRTQPWPTPAQGRRRLVLVEAAERQELAGEFRSVLSGIRDDYPAVTDVNVQVFQAFGNLLLWLEPSLFEDVAEFQDVRAPVPLRTRQLEFHTLNERLDLTDVDRFPNTGTVIFYFNEYQTSPPRPWRARQLKGSNSRNPTAILGTVLKAAP